MEPPCFILSVAYSYDDITFFSFSDKSNLFNINDIDKPVTSTKYFTVHNGFMSAIMCDQIAHFREIKFRLNLLKKHLANRHEAAIGTG